jgi:putative ABC transport system substrate-binding protein
MTTHIRRREFIATLGSAAAWPFGARAQQRSMPTIGLLHSGSLGGWTSMVAAFREGLNDAGYAEGRNLAIEFRWAEGNYDRLPVLAADLVSRQVTVIVTPGSTPATLAAKAATATIPIVFAVGGDPVKFGFVTSFNRPGGNLTGVSLFAVKLEAKRVELLCELVPNATLIALLINPNTPVYESETKEVQSAARFSGGKSLSSMPATRVILTWPSCAWSKSELVQCSCRLTRSIKAGAIKSWHWPHAMRSPQCIPAATSPTSGA